MTSNTLSNNSFQKPSNHSSGHFQVSFPQQFSALKQYHWLFLLCFVVIGCTSTLPVLIEVIDYLQSPQLSPHGYSNSAYYILTSNSALFLCMFALPLVTGNVMFRYLNHKAEVDFFHSLPQTKEHIFVTRYLTGVLSLLLPLVIHGILCYGLCMLAAFSNMPSLYQLASYWGELFLISLAVYSFAVLGTVLTGNTFLAFCTAVGLATAPVALCFVYQSLCDKFYEFFAFDWEFLATLAQRTCIFGNIFLVGEIQASAMDYFLQFLVVGVLAFYCYGKRPSEHSATPVVLTLWRFIIKALGVVCGGSLAGLVIMEMLYRDTVINYLVGSLFFCFLLHVAFEMLFDMDVKSGFRNLKQFALLYGLVGGLGLGISLDITGYDQRLAPVEKISSIEWSGAVLTDPDNIAILHKSMEYAIEGGEYLEYSTFYDYKVNLSQGGSYQRNYYGSFSKEDYFRLTGSQEYLLQSHGYDLTEEDFAEFKDLSEMKILYCTINGYTYTKYLTYAEFEAVYQLILEDVPLLTEDYLRQNTAVLTINLYTGSSSYSLSKNIPVYACMTEALALLDMPAVDSLAEIYVKGETWLFTETEELRFEDLPSQFQEMLLEELIPIHDRYGWYYHSDSIKDMVCFRIYGITRGYMSYEDYDKLWETYETVHGELQ